MYRYTTDLLNVFLLQLHLGIPQDDRYRYTTDLLDVFLLQLH